MNMMMMMMMSIPRAYVFRMKLGINSEYFPECHQPVGACNRGAVRFPPVRNRICKLLFKRN
jgi:hypothetical protein